MSNLTKLASKLPDDIDANSLDRHVGHFRREPHVPVVAVVTLGVAKLITDYDKSVVQPVVQVESIEVLGAITDGDAVTVALDLAAASRARRTHKQDPLPTEQSTTPPACWDCTHKHSDHNADGACTLAVYDEESGETLSCACHGYRQPGEALQLTDGIDVEAAVRQAEQQLAAEDVVEGEIVDDNNDEAVE